MLRICPRAELCIRENRCSPNRWITLDYPVHLRRVMHYDVTHDKQPVFSGNNFDLPASTIADL